MTHTHTHTHKHTHSLTHTQAESLQTNSRLTHLSLRHNRIGNEGCAALADIFPLLPRGPGVSVCRLQALHVSGNEIGDQGAVHLLNRLAQSSRVSTEGNSTHKASAPSSQGAQMTSLDLSSNNLSERTADAAGLLLADNSTLQTLALAQNRLGSGGLRQLAAGLGRNMGTLTQLDVRDAGGDETCVGALAAAIQARGAVTLLRVDGNDFNYDSAQLLAGVVAKNAASRKASQGRRLGLQLVRASCVPAPNHP